MNNDIELYERLGDLEKKINYSFQEPMYLCVAVTHSSFANELSRHMYEVKNNERLEFLGDAVLELVTSEFIFNQHKEMAEGKLSKLRASMVCEPSLAICARKIGLGDYLRLGKGEEQTGGKERDSILSDAFEAVIGAIYLDGGIDKASSFIHSFVLDILGQNQLFKDSKTLLQEIIQRDFGCTPVYVLVSEEGPAHCKEFHVQIQVDGKTISEGKGSSKKSAEQEAAKQAIMKRKDKGNGECI